MVQMIGNLDTDDVYRDMNNGPYKHYIPNRIKTRVRLKTGTLVCM